jgi:hypothetical protein
MEDISSRSLYSENQFPDLTQMPLPPFVLNSLYKRTKDKQIISEFLPKIINYYKVSLIFIH